VDVLGCCDDPLLVIDPETTAQAGQPSVQARYYTGDVDLLKLVEDFCEGSAYKIQPAKAKPQLASVNP
jgi:hypothetical protein